MAKRHVINVDLATIKIPATETRKGATRLLTWGDEVEVVAVTPDHVEVKVTIFQPQGDGSIRPERVSGFIAPQKSSGIKPSEVVAEKKHSAILRIDFVDVQQGDGAVIETPKGKVILVDGGDNQLFARYLANRYRDTSAARPREIDCILVTHGDADHFLGLTEIHRSETDPRLEHARWKRLFIRPRRVYHNGLVKRPEKKDGRSRREIEMLGATEAVTDPQTGREIRIITGLESDLLAVGVEEMNAPFRRWREALESYRQRGEIEFRRLAQGDHDAFDFLAAEGIRIEVLGPLVTSAGNVAGLRFLREPPAGVRVGQESLNPEGGAKLGGFSASHTINGHSIIFKLRYGSFNFLFTGDLTAEAGRELARAHNRGDVSLQAEVFKVPHHGSADFSGAFIRTVAPVISVVSSGDESARKEYIHPRATLIGALGKHSRVEEPLIFVTELVAFFAVEGFVDPKFHELTEAGEAAVRTRDRTVDPQKRGRFFAFSRTAFGIVMIRTDGERLLVYTNSGQSALKEAYAYQMNESGTPEPVAVRKA